jgi:hypothetical protein
VTNPGNFTNFNGSTASTEPSASKFAQTLDPDIHPWERQPAEGDEAYQMYVAYRDMVERKLATFDNPQYTDRGWHSRRARELSSRWSWGYRNLHFDRHLDAIAVEDQGRYRRLMNERQRTVARAAQSKLAQWVTGLDPKTLKPMEAARLFEVFARMERDAAGAAAPIGGLPIGDSEVPEPMPADATLADYLPGIDPTVELDLARALDKLIHR